MFLGEFSQLYSEFLENRTHDVMFVFMSNSVFHYNELE